MLNPWKGIKICSIIRVKHKDLPQGFKNKTKMIFMEEMSVQSQTMELVIRVGIIQLS